MAKRYYWLKLKEGFFGDKRIKKLRKIAGGDTYTIIYLKMQLLSLKSEGILCFEGVEQNFAEEIALEMDEEVENVVVAINFLIKNGLIVEGADDKFLLTETVKNIGSESDGAERTRKFREKKLLEDTKLLQCNADATGCNAQEIGGNALATLCNTEKEKDIEIDIEKRERAFSTDGAEHPTVLVDDSMIAARLLLNDKSFYEVTDVQVSKWMELYPAVDVVQELRNMIGWIESNPTKRKTRSGIARFINSWLARVQDKGGSKPHTGNNTGGNEILGMIARGEFDE